MHGIELPTILSIPSRIENFLPSPPQQEKWGKVKRSSKNDPRRRGVGHEGLCSGQRNFHVGHPEDGLGQGALPEGDTERRGTVSDSSPLPAAITVLFAFYGGKLQTEVIPLREGVCILVHKCLLSRN
ncbi:hypothetical protein mRhiFer1_008084 [Rhinolophus ferrumequinum]|uniref:Uncharacterized protein n=1 Tax=Rhinolophus ferrumequinum TaxID=59479 RepID=A0A7J7WR42_RHIFE|nr:hypothetical protein mRhiFer1_008084 [Rhinolophus ferrumequinum]